MISQVISPMELICYKVSKLLAVLGPEAAKHFENFQNGHNLKKIKFREKYSVSMLFTIIFSV